MIQNRFGQLYTGISTDPERRLKEHQSGGPKAAKALKGKGPLQQVLRIEVGDRSEASKAERQVKKLTREQKLTLINTRIIPAVHSTGSNVKN